MKDFKSLFYETELGGGFFTVITYLQITWH